jgi:hypothetical protein
MLPHPIIFSDKQAVDYTEITHGVFRFPCLSFCFSNYRGEGGALEEQVTDPLGPN